MAKTFCLLPKRVEQFKKALLGNKITISELLNMSSEQRIKLLEKYAGKNAKDVNYLFEKKLILKNRTAGLRNWVNKISEMGRYSEKRKAEIKKMLDEYKAKQKERIFNPKENEAFLNDLADTAIGTHITKSEAGIIFRLSQKVDKLREKYNDEKGVWKSEKDKIEFGAQKRIMENYVDALSEGRFTIKEMLLERYYKGKADYMENKAKAAVDLLADTIRLISRVSVQAVASWDNSFIGRQGINTLMTHPSIWLNIAKKSFNDFYKAIKDKKGVNTANDALMAEVYGRENYLNGNYELTKLIPKREEEVPTTLLERLPVVGRGFKASDTSFSNSAIRARMEIFDKIYYIAKERGVDIKNTDLIKDYGKLVSSLTARGDLGKIGASGGVVQILLWAPKMLKGEWDVLTGHTFGAGLKTPEARKIARINILKIVAETAAVSAMANAIKPGTVETNPLSTDFLAIKINNTRFKYTVNKASIITLLARILTAKTKSSITGITTELNSGKYGSKTIFDVGIDFLANKTTPFTRAVIDRMRGRDFSGKRPTIKSAIYGLTTPISIQNFVEEFYGEDKDGSVAQTISNILDLFGISGSTYTMKENWEIKDTKEMIQFKKEIGLEQFKKANNEYNKIIGNKIMELTKFDWYKKLNDDDKIKEIKKIKRKAKDFIFNKY